MPIAQEIQTYRKNVAQEKIDEEEKIKSRTQELEYANMAYAHGVLKATIRHLIVHKENKGTFILNKSYNFNSYAKEINITVMYLDSISYESDEVYYIYQVTI